MENKTGSQVVSGESESERSCSSVLYCVGVRAFLRGIGKWCLNWSLEGIIIS